MPEKSADDGSCHKQKSEERDSWSGSFLNRTTTNCYGMGQGDGQDDGVINCIGDLLLAGAMAKRDLLVRAGALKW